MATLTTQEAIASALRHHQAGQLAQAESLYRQILEQQPDHADALHYLGVIAQQTGRNEIAEPLIRRAIALRPNYPGAFSNLGNVLKDQGRLDEAIAAYRQAIALRPSFADAYTNLGNVLSSQGELDDAVAAYRRAIAFSPNSAQAHNNLAVALGGTGKLEEAIAACRQAIVLRPNYPEACVNLGNALRGMGEQDAAIAAFRHAIALRPDYPEAQCSLGGALKDKGQLDEAIAAYRLAIAQRPDYAIAHGNLGAALADKGQLIEAIAAYRHAIALKPNFPEAYNNLANALNYNGQSDEAIAVCRQAIVLWPDSAEAHTNLGAVLKDTGDLAGAVAACRQAVALKPDYPEALSNLIGAMHFHSGCEWRDIAEENRRWNRWHAEPLREHIRPHANDRNPDRRLRIGYVSPDLQEHPVGRFLIPLLAHHDRRQTEVFVYAQVLVPDQVTERLRGSADQWRSTVGLSHEQAAHLIRQDKIDILVDLTMHMANNRLLVFARKPAPVQVTYLAYCSSTGLETIDYRLSDPWLDPLDGDDSIYSERTIRLPETYWCYQPHFTTPDVSPLPALVRGVITFGCLNNFCKVSEPTVAAWVKVLRAVPESQLLLHAHQGSHRQRLRDQLGRGGISPDRLRFIGRVPAREYFAVYQQIDIALDTFPYAGGTTTCDALWMGVPVISLAGKTAVGRGGLSILGNAGLLELVGRSVDEYVRIAAELAQDLARLSALRLSLRQRMEQSPLMDAPRFARNLDAAYRQMWLTWCATS